MCLPLITKSIAMKWDGLKTGAYGYMWVNVLLNLGTIPYVVKENVGILVKGSLLYGKTVFGDLA